MAEAEISLRIRCKEQANAIDWNDCLCHSEGQTGKLSEFSDQTWETFRKASEVRNDHITTLMKPYWGNGARGFFHRRCYQNYTSKQNLKYPLKRKHADNVKAPITSRPAKLPRTYDKSKCVICLKEKFLKDRKTTEQLCKCTSEEGITSLKRSATKDLLLGKRLESGNDILYHRSCYKKITRNLYRTMDSHENDFEPKEQSSVFDDSFEVLASEIETTVIKDCKVVTLIELTARFKKLLGDVGIDTMHYKTAYLQRRLEKRFENKLSFWRSSENRSYIVFNNEVPKGQIIETAIESLKKRDVDDFDLSDLPTEDVKQDGLARYVYHTAKAIRSLTLAEAKSLLPWPPSGYSINEDSVVIPSLLYNFFAWVLSNDRSDQPISDSRVEVSPATHRRVMSFAQDIIYDVTRGNVKTPKHVSLAVLVKSLTGSAEVVKVLNRFGHAISYDLLEEAETEIAFNVAKWSENGDICVPSNIKGDVFTTFCWDNNDINEETLSGSDTTHCTNGIAIQSECDWCENDQVLSGCSGNSLKRRSFSQPTPVNITPFISGKRQGPCAVKDYPIVDDNSFKRIQYPSLKKDFCFFLSRLSFDNDLFMLQRTEQTIPAWTGYNMLSSQEVERKDVVGYLQVIDASPTDLSTVHTVLNRSMLIADKLGQKDVVIVFDQAIYAKALEIVWAQPDTFTRVVLRMGAFHIACAFLAVIGKRFSDAGLSDLLLESGVIGSGSLSGVIDGKHYNRAIRIHKIVFESLERCRWKAFGSWLQSNINEEIQNPDMQRVVLELLTEVRSLPSKENIIKLCSSHFIDTILGCYSKFCALDHGPAKAFWNSYIEMVQLLLTFIRATREGDWDLHLESVRQFLPWFFAYDRQNYSRYLPVYWLHMKQLPQSHPEANHFLSSGMFCVRRTTHPFSACPVDQTIEQTLNRDTKTKGGIIGFSINKSAVQRWILTAHERAAISTSCRSLAGLNSNEKNVPKDLGISRIQKDEADVQRIVNTLESWSNPFEPSDQLTSLSSGVVADQKLANDLLKAKDVGKIASEEFLSKRLQSREIPFHDAIPKQALKTFSVKTKVSKVDRNVILKADRNLFARLLVIAQSRQLNMREVLQHELGPIPWSIAGTDGCLVKTNKATLSTILDKRSDHNGVLPCAAAWVFDAMAFIQSLKNIPETFEQLANLVLVSIIKIAQGSKRIDFVADQYLPMSIKDIERESRASSGKVLMKIARSSQQCPRQWKKFLSCNDNKTQLLEFLVGEWSKQTNKKILEGKIVFFAHKGECHKITTSNDIVVTEVCQGLRSNQEEADTKMFLHAKHAMENGFKSIIIRSSDTDVEVLACYYQTFMDSKLLIVSGTSAKSKVIDVSAICKSLGDDVCHALPGLHALSGCDSVSAFSGKGKSKVFDLVLKNDSFRQTICRIGTSFKTTENLQREIEKCVCALYGFPAQSNINEVRFLLFCKSKHIQCHQLPPTKDALQKHIKRANYQTAVWKRAFGSTIDFPPVKEHGWLEENNMLSIDWMDQKPASESLMLLISCGCKTNCSTKRCSCVSQVLSCTDGCRCSELCQNRIQRDLERDESDSEEED